MQTERDDDIIDLGLVSEQTKGAGEDKVEDREPLI